MSEITPNNCRICLSPETIEEFKEINEISFNGGITALDALNEMFVLKVSKHELLTKEMPYKICQRCSKNLEIAVDLWSLAWDSQWILEEWKRSFSVLKNSSSTSSSPPPRGTPGDSGVEFSSLPITSNIMSYCQNVQPNVVGMFPCNQCSSTFALKASLKHHLKQNRNCSQKNKQIPPEKPELKKETDDSIYKTPIKIEPQEVNDPPPASLSSHANFECDECPKSFSSKELLQEHKRNRHLNRLKCKNCDKTFRYNKKLERHFKRRHAGQQVEPVPGNLNQDETDFVPKKKIKLEKGQQNVVGLNFDQKARVVKKNLKKELKVEPIVDHKNAFPCQMCTKSFSKKAYLVSHMRYHKNSNNSQVKIELNSQKIEENLNEEEEKERKLAEYMNKIRKNKEGKYKCMVEGCSLASSLKGNLERHIRRHLNIQKYRCSVCPRRYSSTADLNYHMKIHTKEENWDEMIIMKEPKIKVNTKKEQKPILNPLKASKVSLKEKNLEEKVKEIVKNIKRNQETNAFSCSECPFETFSKTSLLNHIYRHYNLRPYQCDICSRKFTECTTLSQHRQTHIATKEYECPFCHEKCPNQRNLYYHRRVKHPNQSLISAKIPKYQTNEEKEMAEYCRTVQRNEKGKFPCGMCTKDLVNKTNLKLHLKNHYRAQLKKETKATQNDRFAGEDEIKNELMKAMQEISSATEPEPSDDDDDIWNISSDSDNEGTVINFPMI